MPIFTHVHVTPTRKVRPNFKLDFLILGCIKTRLAFVYSTDPDPGFPNAPKELFSSAAVLGGKIEVKLAVALLRKIGVQMRTESFPQNALRE